MKIRLGYVAISNALGKKVTSSSNVTYKTYSKITSEEKKIEKLKSITHSNFEGLEKILRYNIENDIHFYRLTSALIPLTTHPDVPNWGYRKLFKKDFEYIGKLIKKNNMRVDTHPDQFNVINSANDEVVKNTIKNLSRQVEWFEDMDYPIGKMVIHVGGATGGKESALSRFVDNFKTFPHDIQTRLIIENDDNSKVLYVTSEEFTNELIETIRNGNNTAMSKFREKYRNIDVLLIDDIQFIIGKESTQEEFFHTFNSLYSANKQIIISSDKPPKDMEILDERFRSRFEWGLIVDITLPDYETRMAILHKKEDMDGYNVSEDVIKYIANNIKSNIRELEGAFNKVVAYAKLEKKEVTLELAEQALKDIVAPNENKQITADYIISMVAEHFNVSTADLCGNKRSSKIVMPRQVAMYLCREILAIPLKNVGQYLGNRDHTTVMHGVEKIEKELQNNEQLQNTIDTLKKKINPQT